MVKKIFFAASILALSGFVAACGTDEATEVSNPDTETQTEQQETDTTGSEGKTAEDSTDEGADIEQDTSTDEPAEEESTEPAEENAAVSEGTVTTSDSETYELYLLPGYELTAEEPNKDLVFASENDALSMRVETFSTEEAEFAFAEEMMLETIKASNPDAELTELPAFEEAEFLNSKVAEIPTDNGKVTGVVFEKEDLIVRLTIFDLTEAAATEDFLDMGKTISAK